MSSLLLRSAHNDSDKNSVNRYKVVGTRINLLIQFALILTLFSIVPAHLRAAEQTKQSKFLTMLSMATGHPGCLGPNGSMLKKKCEEFYNLLYLGRSAYADNSKTFVQQVSLQIDRIKTPQSYSYFVLLLAVLSRDPALIPKLQELERREILMTVRHAYGKYARQKLSQGKCDKSAPEWATEICSASDGAFERLRSLNYGSSK